MCLGFPGSSAGKESTCNAGDPQFDSCVGKIPWRRDRLPTPIFLGFPGGSDSKESACNVAHLGSIPESGRSPGGGHGNPLQYSCLENPHGQRSLVGYSPWGHKEPDMAKHSTALCVWLYLRACMSVYSFMRLRGMYYSYYKRGILRLREKNLKAFQQVRSWGLKWTIPPPTASLCSQVLPASHQNKV